MSGTRQGYPLCHSYSAQYWKCYLQQLGKKKEISKSIQIIKENLSLFADNMVIYVKTLKTPQEMTSTDKKKVKFLRYKINV